MNLFLELQSVGWWLGTSAPLTLVQGFISKKEVFGEVGRALSSPRAAVFWQSKHKQECLFVFGIFKVVLLNKLLIFRV